MELTTTVPLPHYPFHINHSHRLITMGSCFTENIGKRFLENKFQTLINPFGQQYNPASICNGLNRIFEQRKFSDEDVIEQDEMFHSWQHHSDFSKADKNELLQSINQSLTQHYQWFQQSDYLMLTFGTSHVFEWKQNGKIVSNCHKISGGEFNFRFLSAIEIEQQLHQTLNAFKEINPTAKILLTISPVRYMAFGFFENNLSKANLFVAVNNLLQKRNDSFYFPAFEIVIDELRDYRFFTEDMVHPNRLATQIVWQKLCNSLMQKDTLLLMNDIVKVLAAVHHKPRNANSQAHKKFIATTISKIEIIQQQHPEIDFENEKLKLGKRNF